MSNDLKNLALAILLSTMVLFTWQYFYDAPRKASVGQQDLINQEKKKILIAEKLDLENISKNEPAQPVLLKFIDIDTKTLSGKISLQGLRFIDLQLKKYKENLDPDSPLVTLLDKGYFGEFGWLSKQDGLIVPDKNTIWHCDNETLTDNNTISCSWENNNKVTFQLDIAIDENYLFTIKQKLINDSNSNIKFAVYGRIFKEQAEVKQYAVLHEGMIGVFNNVLKENTYEDISKSRQEVFNNTLGSWAGFTNKYWLTALIPDVKLASKTSFIASKSDNNSDRFITNFLSQYYDLEQGKDLQFTNYFFAGAKEDKVLSDYEKNLNFTLFERSIDYGILYFLTKPLLLLINYFYSIMGNFGLAIIAVTFSLKFLMFPLAQKSFKSMARMKALAPKIEEIKAKFVDDKLKLNQEVMNFYKKEKVNPASGCLPILIQIPIFFSLYKVIFISIAMRQAKFYGWIKDLSIPDPTSIWNLFGLLPWSKFGNFDIGIWPIIMALTMFIQQKLSPAPADATQATVMKLMPLVLVFMLYNLPSGLMIYWSFSNILSILQQYLIERSAKKA